MTNMDCSSELEAIEGGCAESWPINNNEFYLYPLGDDWLWILDKKRHYEEGDTVNIDSPHQLAKPFLGEWVVDGILGAAVPGGPHIGLYDQGWISLKRTISPASN